MSPRNSVKPTNPSYVDHMITCDTSVNMGFGVVSKRQYSTISVEDTIYYAIKFEITRPYGLYT